jgi:hypothetical protein
MIGKGVELTQELRKISFAGPQYPRQQAEAIQR